MFFTVENSINPSQIVKAKETLNVKWLEAVKIYGNKPKKLFKTINKKILIKKCTIPGVDRFCIAE